MVLNKYKRLQIVLFTAFWALWSCDSKNLAGVPQETYPLTAFAVKVGNSWYHSKISQENNLVSISLLASGMGITDIRYTLCDGAEISPDPKSFMGHGSSRIFCEICGLFCDKRNTWEISRSLISELEIWSEIEV